MLKYLIFGVFLASMVVVGILTQKKVKTAEDFVIGGRRMGSWLSAFSYVTTYFSAVIFVGYAGRFGWGFGVSATWIGIGNAVIGTLFAWLLLAERTRRMTADMGVSTLAEFFRERYDSKKMEMAAAVIVFIFLIPYSASVYQGLGYILQAFFSGTFLENIRVSMGLVALITAVYVFFGGYISTAVNSMIQGIIMVGGVVLIVVKVLGAVGGFGEGMEILSSISDKTFGAGALSSIGGPDPFSLVVLVLMTSFGTFGLPQMIAKYSGIKSKAAGKRATLYSLVGSLIVSGGAYFMGGFSRALAQTGHIEVDPTKLDTVMPRIFQAILSEEVMAILVILMLSASMSTLAAVVLVSAPTFSKTILKTPKLMPMRILSIVFVLVSYVVAITDTPIVTLMSFSWGAVSGAFIGPYIWGLYSKKITRAGSWAGMACGLGTVVVGAVLIAVTSSMAEATKWAPRLAVLALAVSMVVTPAASLLTARLSKVPEGAKFV
ncbi:MAG: sodium:solute symporter [Clostridia bacterium]|nr:sodium:solute symporter [Clostridia bacterium]